MEIQACFKSIQNQKWKIFQTSSIDHKEVTQRSRYERRWINDAENWIKCLVSTSILLQINQNSGVECVCYIDAEEVISYTIDQSMIQINWGCRKLFYCMVWMEMLSVQITYNSEVECISNNLHRKNYIKDGITFQLDERINKFT